MSITRGFYAEQVTLISEFFSDPATGLITADGQEFVSEAKALDEQLQAVFAEFDSQGLGLTLKSVHGDSWVIIVPDASSPGCFRHQSFAKNGWTGHMTTMTAEAAVLDAFESGYRLLAERTTLDQLAATREWAKGIEQLDLITRHNNGLISWQQFHEAMNQVAAKYAEAA